ncbi:HDIG domain-containing metalloprotein [Coprothermobacter platensis]|uniref:HDIG domain-containing metalloprotein n=1 Tax=Coprothermobacter platensis TaxID=108819 RepID=UPI0003771AF7|nr:HDIG domain-containing metalloprotein [Coprothermobacter platensis]
MHSIDSNVDLERIYAVYDKYNLPDNVRRHIEAVALGVARVIAVLQKKGVDIDVDLLITGTLLHDIGRSVTHDISHGVIGSEIVLREGFSQEVANLVERHIGAGLTEEEAKGFGLPVRSYVPVSLEEKILAAVDNLAFGDRMASKSEFIDDIKRKFDTTPLSERFFKLYDEVSSLLGEDLSLVVRGENSFSQSL